MTEFHHIPIMLGEVLELLAPERGGIFVDGTLGGGGHSEGILKRLTDGRLYGIDRDGEAIAAASERPKPFGDKFKAIRGNFFDMKSLLANEGLKLGNVSSEYSSSYGDGEIIYQQYKAGTKLTKNSTVSVTISKGKKPEPTTVPATQDAEDNEPED